MINEIKIIEQGFIVFCIVITIWACMLPNMLLGWIGDYGDKHFPNWLKSIVFDCSICMMPYYGSAAYWIIFGQGWMEWVLVILVGMGMATIFVKMKRN